METMRTPLWTMWILFFSLMITQVYTCGYPGSPAHATVAFSSEVIGPNTVASYSCESGYELLGPGRRVCGDNGTWMPVGIPFCVLNVATGKAPMQSSVAGNGVPQKAVDGSTSTFFNPDTCTMTEAERAPWWYVNLLEPYMVQLVRIDFGLSCCSNNRPATIVIRVGNNRPDLGVNPICHKYTGFIAEGRPLFLPCTAPMPGAFVSIHFEGPPGNPLSICETFVYTDQALPIERCPAFRDQPLGSTATYNGKCYIFYNNQPLNFDNARNFCEIRGGSLIDETNPALQGFLSWELYRRHRNDPNGQYWMGAIRDPRDRNNWKWINGKDVTISFWNLPGTNENCSRFDGSKGWLWSDTNCFLNLNFICQFRPTSCGNPDRPENSTIQSRSLDIGSVIDYHCDPGHLLVGPNIRTCLPTGFFSEFPPKCRYLQCGPPAPIANGAYTLLNGTLYYMSTTQYFCNEGYVLVGRGNLQCDVDEKWNSPPPRCEPIQCRQPPDIAFGHIILSNNSTVYGTVAEYFCQSGYIMDGANKMKCASAGFWDAEAPVCRREGEGNIIGTGGDVPNREPVPDSSSFTATPDTIAQPSRYPFLTSSSSSETTVPAGHEVFSTQKPASSPPIRPMPPWVRPPHRPTASTSNPYPRPHSDPSIVTLRPEPNETPDGIHVRPPHRSDDPPINTLGRKNGPPSVGIARLNTGGIIALGVFGGFVFLAAIITIIVIIVRRTKNKRHSRGSTDSTTVSTYDSAGSGEHGLHKYYKRAWDNLRFEGKGGGGSAGFSSKLDGHSRHHHHHHHHHDGHSPDDGRHAAVTRRDTLDEPITRGNGRGTVEGFREANEILVSDVAALYSRPEKKRDRGHSPSCSRRTGTPARDEQDGWFVGKQPGHSRRDQY